MDQEKLQQLVQKVAELLSQGKRPEEIMQVLVQQGIDQNTAQQIIQAAAQMLQQAQGQQGGAQPQQQGMSDGDQDNQGQGGKRVDSAMANAVRVVEMTAEVMKMMLQGVTKEQLIKQGVDQRIVDKAEREFQEADAQGNPSNGNQGGVPTNTSVGSGVSSGY